MMGRVIPCLLLLLVSACGAAVSNHAGPAVAPPENGETETLPTDDIPRLDVPPEYAGLKPPRALDNPEFVERGRRLYLEEAGCAMCHGDTGEGDGQMAPQYTDPPVNDLTDPVLHNSMTDQYIYWRLVEIEESKYSPTSGMTGYAGVAWDGEITDEESEKVWAVVAFVRSLRKD